MPCRPANSRRRSQPTQQTQLSELRGALEKSAAASQADENTCDRRLIGKLLVTYFERDYDKDVLDVIARMMALSEDEKEKIGLAGRGFWSKIGSTVGSVLRVTDDDEKAKGESETLADKWIEFLISGERL